MESELVSDAIPSISGIKLKWVLFAVIIENEGLVLSTVKLIVSVELTFPAESFAVILID